MPTVPSLPADTKKLREQLQQDQAPSARGRTPLVDVAGIQGVLGRQHSSRRITLNQMYEMREDSILSFAKLMRMVAILTSKWYIECADAQKAAFLDNALRRIYGRLTLQFFISQDFGFQGLVKSFGLLNPGWMYLNKDAPSGPKMEKVWDQGEDIPALVWEPFVTLRPENIWPRWNDADGSFNGIRLSTTGFVMPGVSTFTETNAQGKEQVRDVVDLRHSLWVVNQRDEEFGSIWGRSAFRSAFDYWWGQKLAMTILNRSVERKGDPAVVVRYPKGSSTYGGAEMDNQAIAFRIGQMARSGSVLAIPSESHDEDDGGKNNPKWSVEYLTADDKFDKVESIMSYLDTQKFRAMMLPEQAVTEGRGGTSSRNVAKEMGQRSQELQIAVQTEHDSIINNYMLEQLAEAHYPILSKEPARKVTKSFGDDEAELGKTLLESMANKDANQLPIDWRALAERYNLETITPEEVAAEKERRVKDAQAMMPPPVPANPNNGKAGVTDTGFYYDAKERIELSEDETLLASLPPTKHYQDRAVLATTRLLRKLWFEMLTEHYDGFARYLEEDDVVLEDVDLAESDEQKRQRKIVKAIMDGWSFASEAYTSTIKRTASALGSIFARAGELELKRASVALDDWNPDERELAKWIKDNAASMVRKVENTTRKHLREFLTEQVRLDANAPTIAKELRKSFSDFPAWRADLIARNEVRRFYNAATLFAARSAGREVQAIDAQLGEDRSDPVCIARNGRLFNVEAAFKEDAKEHPRGTLAWRIMPGSTALSIVRVSAKEAGDFAARIDRKEGVIYLREGLSQEHEGAYLLQVGDWLERIAA